MSPLREEHTGEIFVCSAVCSHIFPLSFRSFVQVSADRRFFSLTAGTYFCFFLGMKTFGSRVTRLPCVINTFSSSFVGMCAFILLSPYTFSFGLMFILFLHLSLFFLSLFDVLPQ